MLIDCPSCARSYHVARAEIGESGRTLICPRCEASWFVDGDGARRDLTLAAPTLELTGSTIRPREIGHPRPARWRAVLGRAAVPSVAAAGLVSFVCLVGVGVVGVVSRQSVVRDLPRTAGLYRMLGMPVNVRGLEFTNVAARVAAPSTDLAVTGEIRNVARHRVPVTRIAYEVRDAAGVAVASWTEAAPTRTLAARASVPFTSRPHAIPGEGQSVMVRFDDGRDDS